MKIRVFTNSLNRSHIQSNEVNRFTEDSKIIVKNIENHVTNGFQSASGKYEPEIVTIVTYVEDKGGELRPTPTPTKGTQIRRYA